MALRVLHIGKFFPPYMGGMEVFLSDLIEAQRAQGIEAFALVHGTPRQDDPHWLVRVPVQFNLVYAPIALGFRSALGNAIRAFQPDVLHLHLPNNSALWALTLPAARKTPCVVHWHSDVVMSDIKWSVALAYFLYRPFEYAVLDRAHMVFATSPPYLEASPPLRDWKEKCRVVPLGVKLQEPLPSPRLRAELQWRSTARLKLLSIGRLTYYKGFETLVRAVQGMVGVELLIAGGGELHESLEALITSTTPMGSVPAVRLLGSVRDDEKHALLAGCDVFCLASRERTEAFGIVLLEAMMHMRPCIVTDLPGSGMPWVIAKAHAGLHVPIEDVDSWRSTIARLQHDSKMRMQFGENGHQALLKYFDITQCERVISQHYKHVTQSSRLTPRANSRLLVVISTRNHAASIEHLMRRVRALVEADLLIVDNRSTDATCHIAETEGAKVLSPLLTMTSWGSLQTGLRYGLAQGYSTVITIDAESRYEVEEIKTLLNHRYEGDLVVGSFPARISWIRRLAWQWFRWITGFALRDFVSGFRLYNLRSLEAATSTEATLLDYQDIGTLLLLRRRGLRIAEVALSMQTLKVDKSKIFQSWANAVRYIAVSSLLSIAHWRSKS
ncbi:glycosyltransferase [Acidovorax sp. 106]|uniref:glycosyltransferase n=1 Tax=Acidovorax sp. 106 TaxID=2135637 RepID=UPI000EAEA0B9|nr:glycosyltransferase [Acidovorax sp. 106]RLJ38665.1 glycosyltransferase involved in cell wall biosynthesis [Acidovorax sp. 106]